MNIWSLDKHDSIKHLLLLLTGDMPEQAYTYCDTSGVDHKAIRLCHNDIPNMCVYIYTYGHVEERYGIHLEYPVENDIEYSDTMDIYENIGYTQLKELLKVHFEVSDQAEAIAQRKRY